MTHGLKGRVAVVTGGGSGIGREIAKCLAEHGARVAVLDLNTTGAEETANAIADATGEAIAVTCDTSDETSVQAAAAAVSTKLGSASILVNNAGVLRGGSLDSLTLADWNTVLGINLTGYFICTSAFGKPMRDVGAGAIVHIGSIASRFAQSRGGAYSAAKAGVIGLSHTIAVEWGPLGIRSNVVHPGMIRTALSEASYADQDMRQRRERVVASRRTGVPRDLADAVAFLCSDNASYINGAELTIDGGFSRMGIDLIPRPYL